MEINLALLAGLVLEHGQRTEDGRVVLEVTDRTMHNLSPGTEVSLHYSDTRCALQLVVTEPAMQGVIDGGELVPECSTGLTQLALPST